MIANIKDNIDLLYYNSLNFNSVKYIVIKAILKVRDKLLIIIKSTIKTIYNKPKKR